MNNFCYNLDKYKMAKVSITKFQLISSIIFNGGNTYIFITLLKAVYSNPGILKFLTYLSYCANSIFLFFCILCDIFLYLNRYNNSVESETDYKLMAADDDNDNESFWFERLNDWNRNTYSLICNPFSFFVTANFWILYFLGESYIKVSSGFYPMLRTYYLHLTITILIIIDIFVSKRKKITSFKYYDLVCDLLLLYCIAIIIMKYKFNIIPYAFLNSGIVFLLCYMLISFILLHFCYYINIWLVNLSDNN